MQKTSVGGDPFLKAMDMMKSLKSDALYTPSILTTYEDGYQAALKRIPVLEGFVTADEAALTTVITAIAKPTVTAQKATIITKAKTKYPVTIAGTTIPDLNTDLNTLLNGLGLTAAQLDSIKEIAARINLTVVQDLSLRQAFVDPTGFMYGKTRTVLCTDDSTSAFDLYAVGTIKPRFTSSATSPTFTQKTDSCGTGANIKKLTEYKCVNLQSRNIQNDQENKQETVCPFGCKANVCLKGDISPATVTSDSAGAVTLSDVKDGQPFYLKINANRASDTTVPLTIEATSTAFSGATPKCTLTTKTATFSTVGQSMVLGPVVCTNSATFDFSLKDGSTEIGKASTSVSIGTNGMKELVVIAPAAPIVMGTELLFTVRAMGTNGYPYNKFTSPTVIQINGDTAAKNDDTLTIGTTAGGDTEKTFRVTFSKPGTFTIMARGGTNTSTYTSAPITVTVG